MSENKEPEIREQNNGSEHEPIESIEQTVADLKKKIEELTEEQENARENEGSVAGEKIAAFTENAKEIVTSSIDEIKAKAESISDRADLTKTIAYIKENAMKAVTMTKDRIDEIKKDPEVQINMDKAIEAIRNAATIVNEHAKKAGEYISDHIDDDTKETLQEACETASKALDDVQETISKAKTKAAEIVSKGAESLKDLFGKKDE